MMRVIITAVALLFLVGAVLTLAATPSTNATSTNATSTNATMSQEVVDKPHFKAILRGIQQFNPQTNATGEAYFRILDDENIAYVVDVSNISSVRDGIITYWTGGPDREITHLRLAPLEGIASAGEVASGTAEGTFGVGNFSQRAPVEQSIPDFVKNVLEGNIYLKIGTVQSPVGEIAGKLVPQVD